MMIHPDIARWLVAAEQERLAALAGRRRLRPGTARPCRRRGKRRGD